MAFSTQRAVSDGTLSDLNVSIGYIKQADIQVFYDDLPADDATWGWVGDTNVIHFTPTIPNDVEVLLKRSTQLSSVINLFTSGAGFTNKAMDTNSKQFLYLNQEAVEGAALTDIFNDVDFHGYTAKNIGPAVDPNDAVSLGQYQADADGAFVSKTTAVAAAAAALVSELAAAASAAAALVSQNAAAASAGTATTQAGNAAASASSASGSASTATTAAGTATTQAGNASSSASDAAASAAAAAASAGTFLPVEGQTHAATSKAPPVDADEIPLVDSAASFGLKKLTWANLKATLKTYLDTFYATLGANSNITSLTGLTTPLSVGQGGTGRIVGASTSRVNTYNGLGAVDNKILRFSGVAQASGSDITRTDNANNGTYWTVVTPGTYGISFTMDGVATNAFGISLNSSQLTTGVGSIATNSRLGLGYTGSGNPGTVATTVILAANDVIRAHCDGTASGVPAQCQFTITGPL